VAAAAGRFTPSLSGTMPPEGGKLKDFMASLAVQLAITVVESVPFKELLHHLVDPLLFFLLQ
jgi:hypothetical protein